MKHAMVRWLVVGSVAAALLACSRAKSEADEIKEVVAVIPWMLNVYQGCVDYKATQRDAKKGDISNRTYGLIRRSSVKDARAIVEKVLPVGDAENPNEYMVQLTIGGKVRFTSQSGKRPVKKGTPIFEQAAKLVEGQCVIFSATDIEPMTTFQRGKVCEHRYYAQLADLKSCTQ